MSLETLGFEPLWLVKFFVVFAASITSTASFLRASAHVGGNGKVELGPISWIDGVIGKALCQVEFAINLFVLYKSGVSAALALAGSLLVMSMLSFSAYLFFLGRNMYIDNAAASFVLAVASFSTLSICAIVF